MSKQIVPQNTPLFLVHAEGWEVCQVVFWLVDQLSDEPEDTVAFPHVVALGCSYSFTIPGGQIEGYYLTREEAQRAVEGLEAAAEREARRKAQEAAR